MLVGALKRYALSMALWHHILKPPWLRRCRSKHFQSPYMDPMIMVLRTLTVRLYDGEKITTKLLDMCLTTGMPFIKKISKKRSYTVI